MKATVQDGAAERSWCEGPRAHAIVLATFAAMLGIRWALFDSVGRESPIPISLMLLAVLGYFLRGNAVWTALVVGAVPILWVRYVGAQERSTDFLTLKLAGRLVFYFSVGGFITWQQVRWRRALVDAQQRERSAIEANARWQMASEFAQLGTFDWDLRRETVAWSPGMERLHGFPEGTHDGKAGTGFRVIHPDDVPTIQRAVEEASRTGETNALVYRVRLPNGRERWIQGVGRAQFEKGTARRIVGICTDVTDRHEAFLAAARYEALTKHAPVGIYHSDAQGRCLYVNQAFTDITGRTLEQLTGDAWVEMVHPDDRERNMHIWSDVNVEPRPFVNHLRYLLPDGGTVWAITHNAPLYDDHGLFVGYVGSVTDVTSLKRTEEALEAGEAKFRALVDNADPAVFMKDVDGRYLIVNATFERLVDLPAAEIVGRTDLELFPAAVAGAFRTTDERVRRSGQAEHVEETLDLADGPRAYLSVKFPVIDAHGRVIAVGGIATDITSLKRIEENLRRDRRMLRDLIDVQEQERQYICNELHDGTIQYLVGALMQLQSPAMTRDANRAALERVESLLARATAEARRLIGGVRSSLLDDLGVAAAIDDLLAQNREQGLEVRYERDDDFKDLDEKTAVTIFRVAQEALHNVRKHGGTESAEIELRRAEREVVLTVRDRGRGFEPEGVRPECFGLRGMRERVLLAGGEFQLTSEPTKGTIVRAVLPLVPPRRDEGR